ncbi:MAG: aminotransferase class I/II-fold pyridoxal phosphate-dependent enzyme [Phycisphaerae bacterium]|nr:aminotransferase class I/II-fold pyridoxal phosphate-dependent enzyme [Phycisphaerae bacterium]MDW8261090.1 aminotransferase class I/II-fold pyridoxal phosphate-dependent enzyme [Phycisphaerales bacterium]
MDCPPFSIEPSARIARLPPYLFGRINRMKHEKRVAGIDIIDLGMGNPTDPTPPAVVEKLAEAARDSRNHRYSVSHGIAGLRREVANRYKSRFGVTLDPETEVIVTIGSKEGFSHLCLALLGPGDTAVVPDPAFPAHLYAPALAGANVIRVPIGNDQEFLDRIERTISGLYPAPKLAIFNYPHNPTSMTIEPGFWERAIDLCRRHRVMILSDYAYGEITFDDYHAPSFLATCGAKEVGVEFTTMSKSFNMAGWRVGFCCGNAEMIRALATIKGYYDYGHFAPIWIASVIAMRECGSTPREQSKIYQKRRDVVCRGLDRLGWSYQRPRAGMFVWARVPDDHLAGAGSIDFCLRMMDQAKVALAPGRAFGEHGEGFVRIALVENEQRLEQAMRNLRRALMPKGRAGSIAC